MSPAVVLRAPDALEPFALDVGECRSPALSERSKLRVANFYADFDEQLAEFPFVAGDTF